MSFTSIASKILGSSNARLLKPYEKKVKAINALADEMSALSDDELRGLTDKFKARLAGGEKLNDLIVEAFAAVREAATRSLGLTPYDVQLIGGMALNDGNISEMKTGEGKTLVATLPSYLNALTGKGVHVVTVNDYLAKRDSDWMSRVLAQLGMTTGCITNDLDDAQRREAYACDVTYATNNELGFDYLRDNMKTSMQEMVQRGHNFAVIDEVDSILIDEARTPLIISGPTDDKSDFYIIINELVQQLVEEDYEIDEKTKGIHLTEEGNEHIEELLREKDLMEGDFLYEAANITVVHHINNALRAVHMFQRDKDYIVKDDQVVIIDEFTGRMMEGRRWSDGLHQAVEAKEGTDIKPENVTLASITFQNYFRLYDKLSGMTGTALTEEAEFEDIYKLKTLEVPTNRPILRDDQDDELYITMEQKYKAIAAQIVECHHQKQPVLVGTVSIENSELLANMLSDRKFIKGLSEYVENKYLPDLKPGKDDDLIQKVKELSAFCLEIAKKEVPVPHNVLNARFHEQEADIVANAGYPGAVTIATNMAGRGTDIQLGGSVDREVLMNLPEDADEETIAKMRAEVEEKVAKRKAEALEAGGLYVLATERHESRRIDNQLRGRSGRQGDPGTTKFFLSLEDDLMRIFGTGMERMLKRFGIKEDETITHPWFTRSVETAQKKIEERNYDMRKNTLKYDDVVNDQRKAIFEQRIEFMQADTIEEIIADMRQHLVEDLVAFYIPPKSYVEKWDVDGLKEAVRETFGRDFPVQEWAAEEGVADTEITERLIKETDLYAAKRAADIGSDTMRQIERMVLLQAIDTSWREHLQQIEHLRSVVGIRAMGQKDPLNEFKTESFTLFEQLLDGLRKDVVKMLMHVQVQQPSEAEMELRRIAEMSPSQDQMIDTHVDATTGLNDAGHGGPDGPQKAYGGERGYGASSGATTIRARKAAEMIDPDDQSTWGRVPRNAPCPCGSGGKFKHCHGKMVL